MEKIRHYFRMLAEDRHRGAAAGFWYGVLEQASKMYRRAVEVRRNLYDKGIFKTKSVPVPVISIGNLTWGGSGKTPLVEYFIRRISEMKKVPLVLTRGYSHDEVEQYREHFPQALIGVGKNRWKTAGRFLAKQHVDAALLDDGFQHWAVRRDLDIVTMNTLNPVGNGKLIPRGPMREPLEALRRAHVVVLTHVNLSKPEAVRRVKRMVHENAPKAEIVEAYLEPLFFYRAGKKNRISLEKLRHQRVTTFSAVGVPRSFQLILAAHHIKPVRNFEYTDHHMFSAKELEEIKSISETASSQEIITTEKDYFRAPDQISKVLSPLILATRLRVSSGEELLDGILSRLLGVKR